MKKITKEFLMKKITDKWFAENKEMVKDLENLATELTLFSTMWGIKFEIGIADPEEQKGRELGIGFDDTLEKIQDYANKMHKQDEK